MKFLHWLRAKETKVCEVDDALEHARKRGQDALAHVQGSTNRYAREVANLVASRSLSPSRTH